MRIRNIKLNVFLNEEETKILQEKSNKVNLTKSDFIRMLIDNFDEIKLNKNDIDNILTKLDECISNVDSVRADMKSHHYYYQELKFNDSLSKLSEIKKIISNKQL